jgi:UDP-N-acetylglucosamine--N-acetylmuramyl-(pentapeptide) pyrophosphoryl-undecaprenol N-acetylglucosamine transferase
VKKIGEFIYPWGSGHFSRMMTLNDHLTEYFKDEYEIHYSSKGEIYQKLLERFPSQQNFIHEILMPTPIDGKMGPSVTLSMLNLLLPISKNPPLLKQISSYLKEERKLYNKEKFDLVINDGDMGSNVLAKNRGITSLFVTNQFRPKLWKSRFYFYPSVVFISKQIAKATRIIVADSPPPYTICEYNLNFSDEVKEKVIYVGHFAIKKIFKNKPTTDLEKLIQDNEFGYWMRTGNRSTNNVTGEKYEEVFHDNKIKNEKRIVSHARNDSSIDRVLGKDGKKYSILDAVEKKIDWIQIDIGFLTETEKQTVLRYCKYAVINGSHTVMGEILGVNSKPIVGIPVYDEHTNNLRWAEEKNLGIMAQNKDQVIDAISKITNNYNKFQEKLEDFSKNFMANGAESTAKIVRDAL